MNMVPAPMNGHLIAGGNVANPAVDLHGFHLLAPDIQGGLLHQ